MGIEGIVMTGEIPMNIMTITEITRLTIEP